MKRFFSKKWESGIILFLVTGSVTTVSAQIETTHFNSEFKGNKPYRIFLPADYERSQKRYPVIYFFHGNQGTHQFATNGVQQLVNENGVILVALNGRSVPLDMRPYNVGYHSNIKYEVQFKDYFLEFVHQIDSTYRTINNRSHRALIGHSMDGYMSFFLAGRNPQLVGTVVSSMGSPKFFIGCSNNYTFYCSDCSGYDPNAARSTVATSMFGPWKELGNPTRGVSSLSGMGPELTVGGQITYFIKVDGKEEAFIAVFDVWTAENKVGEYGYYLFPPVTFTDKGFEIHWIDEWDLAWFDTCNKKSQ